MYGEENVKDQRLTMALHAMPWIVSGVLLILSVLVDSIAVAGIAAVAWVGLSLIVVGLRMGGFIKKPKRDGFDIT